MISTHEKATEGPAVNIPATIDDPINSRILAVSEDQVQGFHERPFDYVAAGSGVPVDTVIERVRAMLEAGTIRRVRQTLMATSLAQGALAAWSIPASRLDEAFDFMYLQDPFSGHVVIRSTDNETPGSRYRLWTTLKVPQGFSLNAHARYLQQRVGAEKFLLMPAKRLFALGVGHLRRRDLTPGSKSDVLADVIDTNVVELTDAEWAVLISLKREFEPGEICSNIWEGRAAEAGLSLADYVRIASNLQERGVIGRFSTFLEHVKPTAGDQRVTRYNALFHWAVPAGREIEAGRQVGRFHIMTHAYWREGGAEFNNVNIMGVAHGLDKALLLEHKTAIDKHLGDIGIPVSYTNVFWGGRSEIKPSEVVPDLYREFCESQGLNLESMREHL